MNYKICGKLRDSGKEDIRVVHVDHLIHFERSRAVLFPTYGPESHKVSNSRAPGAPDSIPAVPAAPKDDIFASEPSEVEIGLQSNITSPSISKSDDIEPNLITNKTCLLYTSPSPRDRG